MVGPPALEEVWYCAGLSRFHHVLMQMLLVLAAMGKLQLAVPPVWSVSTRAYDHLQSMLLHAITISHVLRPSSSVIDSFRVSAVVPVSLMQVEDSSCWPCIPSGYVLAVVDAASLQLQ